MQLDYVVSGFKRELGNFTELPLINMFTEQEPTLERISLLSRPGLKTVYSIGTGPIQAMYKKDGTLSGSSFAVSGNQLFDETSLKGAIAVTDYVSLASYSTHLWLCGGSNMYTYDGTTIAEVTIEDVPSISKILVGSSRAVAIQKDSQTFYWTDPMATTFDVLSFAEAEYMTDNIRDALFVGDTLVLFGSDTVEFWPSSSTSPDLPFTPLPGRTFQYGVKNMGAATAFKNGFAWVSNTNSVYLNSPDNTISFPGLDAEIEKENKVKLWSFRLNGIDFLALRLSGTTWVWNSSSSSWSQFLTFNQDNWIPSCSEGDLFGSGIDGRIIAWDQNNFNDFGDKLERRFRAGKEIISETLRVDSIIVRVNGGYTPFDSGLYSDPVIETRTSKDGGFNWDKWRPQSLGKQGEYRKTPIWRGCGVFSYPGFLVEVRVTDPVPFAVSNVVINEEIRGI
jgi:hypothetical protein